MTEVQADAMPVPPAPQEDIPAEILEAVQKSAEMDTIAEAETTDTSEQAELRACLHKVKSVVKVFVN
jgi:hypothetical protein